MHGVAIQQKLVLIEESLVGGLIPGELLISQLSSLRSRAYRVVVHVFVAVVALREHLIDGVGSGNITLQLPSLLFLDRYFGGE